MGGYAASGGWACCSHLVSTGASDCSKGVRMHRAHLADSTSRTPPQMRTPLPTAPSGYPLQMLPRRAHPSRANPRLCARHCRAPGTVYSAHRWPPASWFWCAPPRCSASNTSAVVSTSSPDARARARAHASARIGCAQRTQQGPPRSGLDAAMWQCSGAAAQRSAACRVTPPRRVSGQH